MSFDFGNLLVGFGAGVAGVLALLRWREQHEKPLVSVWIGHWRKDAQDAGEMIADFRFSNRGHDRELNELWLELPRASTMLDYTLWKAPETVRAGSTRGIRVSLEAIRHDAGVYMPNGSEREIAAALAGMRVTFTTGDGERHSSTLEKRNRERLVLWVERRERGRPT